MPVARTRHLVKIEALFLRMTEGTARALLGRCAPVSEGRTALLNDVGRARLLAAVERGVVDLMTGPRITLYDRQRGNMSILKQVSYVKDVEIQGQGEAREASPVVDVLNEGTTVDLRPFVGADGRLVTLDLEVSTTTLRRPMARIPLTVDDRPFEIQVPEVTTWAARRVVRLRPGTHGLFKAEGGTWVLVTAEVLPPREFEQDVMGAEIDLVPRDFAPPRPPGR